MEKIRKIVAGLIWAIFFMTISSLSVYAYDGNAAVSYASTHMASGHVNDQYNCPNSWKCAAFVSACLQEGGMGNESMGGCGSLYNFCKKNGTVYTLNKITYKTDGDYGISSSGNAANLLPGDVVISCCKVCGSNGEYVHAGLVSGLSGGYVCGYAHNANKINVKLGFSRCKNGHGTSNQVIYGIHFNEEISNSTNPVGLLEFAAGGQGEIEVAGWAYQPDVDESIWLDFYIGDTYIGSLNANQVRGDVRDAYGCSEYVGFSGILGTDLTGTQTINAFAINKKGGPNVLIGSKEVNIESGSTNPIGLFEFAAGGKGEIEVAGWAFQPGVDESVEIHFYIGNTFIGSATANQSRNDVKEAYGCSEYAGFSEVLETDLVGNQIIKAFAINEMGGMSILIGNKEVYIKDSPSNPIGNFEEAKGGKGIIQVAGWAFQPEVDESIEIHFYIGDRFIGSVTANQSRGDVRDAYGCSEYVGFSGTLETDITGKQIVNAFAINKEGGSNVLIDSKEVYIEQLIKVSMIDISESDITILEDEEKVLDISIFPENATDKTVIYKSNNSGVVTVDTQGVIKGIKAGDAVITVTSADGKVSAICIVHVIAKSSISGEASNPSTPSNPNAPSEPSIPDASGQTNDTSVLPAIGTVVKYDGLKYKITKPGKEVACVKLDKNSYITVVIPNAIIHDGVAYKVTTIAKNAFKNNKKIESVTIGKNVTSIGSKAFYGCSKLKTLKIKTVKLTTKKIGSKAFSKTLKSMKVTVPKKKFKTYKSMLIKKGVNKKAKFKKG